MRILLTLLLISGCSVTSMPGTSSTNQPPYQQPLTPTQSYCVTSRVDSITWISTRIVYPNCTSSRSGDTPYMLARGMFLLGVSYAEIEIADMALLAAFLCNARDDLYAEEFVITEIKRLSDEIAADQAAYRDAVAGFVRQVDGECVNPSVLVEAIETGYNCGVLSPPRTGVLWDIFKELIPTQARAYECYTAFLGSFN